MKKLIIKGTFPSIVQDNQWDINDWLKTVLRIPQQGANYVETAAVLDLIRKLFSAGDAEYILIEKEEHTNLVKHLKNFKYPVRDPAINDWIDSIEKLPDVKVEEK